MEIKVFGEDRLANVAFVVCAHAEDHAFDDDVFTVCADCGVAIAHRPHAPAAPKICTDCFVVRALGDPTLEVGTTPKMGQELASRGFRVRFPH